MSLSCRETRGLLPDYASEKLEPADRHAFRAHLADCRDCREEAARSDAGLLFAGIAAEEVSSEDVTRILAGVRAGMTLRRTQRRLEEGIRDRRGKNGRRRLFLTAAAVVAVFTLLFPGEPVRRAEPPATARLVRSRNSSEGPLAPAARPAAVPMQEIPNAKFPADATIYDWSPGGGGQPRVVWIVDRTLDI